MQTPASLQMFQNVLYYRRQNEIGVRSGRCDKKMLSKSGS